MVSSAAIVFGRALPDPGQLIFWMRRSSGYGLYVIDAQRLIAAPLVKAPPMLVVDTPRLSRNGHRVAFEAVDDGRLRIFVKDSEANTLYETRSGIEDRLPALSPDGRHLALWSTPVSNEINPRFQNWFFYLFDLQQASFRQVTDQLATLPSGMPFWSPDGKALAVRFWRAGVDEGMSVLNIETGELRQLPEAVDKGGDIVWSPDGEKIAFRSARDLNVEIYLLNLTDDTIRNLTQHPASDFQPAWSPDSREIAFVSNRSGGGNIYIMRADGQAARQITFDGGWQPNWSPNRSQIAFHARQQGRESLYVVNVDGSDLRWITTLNEQNVFIGWYVVGE
jgi:Tol biopolymer transport system component